MPGVLLTVVEGHSEVIGLPVLLRRLTAHLGLPYMEIPMPFRVKRHAVVRDGELERAIRQAIASRDGATCVLILLDADDDCPGELGPELLARATGTTSLSVGVVLANREVEAWLLAGVESLRGVHGIEATATAPDDPERPRDAKRELTARMEGTRGYVETDDLPAFVATLDLDLARGRSPSLDKFCREIVAMCA